MRSRLEGALGAGRVLTGPSDLLRYATDASPYSLVPKAVVVAEDPGDVARTLALARAAGEPVTLRASGSSLNGQALGGGIVVDVAGRLTGMEVLEDGVRCRVRPGTVLADANRALAPYGRRLGPDPASAAIATVGGVVANNSGGMRCGVTRDSYSTVRALKLVLASGAEIDTADPRAEKEFRAREPALATGLAQLRDELRADPGLVALVRRKFEIKNTMGYRLCALLDADSPLEIFRRLVVGSEGTLGFIAEVEFETVPLPVHTTVAWIHFPSLEAAVAPVPGLVAAGASAVELMMAPTLALASEHVRGAPRSWRELPDEAAALLVEFGADGEGALDEAERRAADTLATHPLLGPPEFRRESAAIGDAWRVRESLHPLQERLRPAGSALIIEDVCVRPQDVAAAATDIRTLLSEHGHPTHLAGHASVGNLHFHLTPDLSGPAGQAAYHRFIEALAELILDRYDGSLKAEHGTGLSMAPYLEREWGPQATAVMRRIKRLADPGGVLAPGVLVGNA